MAASTELFGRKILNKHRLKFHLTDQDTTAMIKGARLFHYFAILLTGMSSIQPTFS